MKKRHDAQAARRGFMEMVEEHDMRETIQINKRLSIFRQEFDRALDPLCPWWLDRHPFSVKKWRMNCPDWPERYSIHFDSL